MLALCAGMAKSLRDFRLWLGRRFLYDDILILIPTLLGSVREVGKWKPMDLFSSVRPQGLTAATFGRKAAVTYGRRVTATFPTFGISAVRSLRPK